MKNIITQGLNDLEKINKIKKKRTKDHRNPVEKMYDEEYVKFNNLMSKTQLNFFQN